MCVCVCVWAVPNNVTCMVGSVISDFVKFEPWKLEQPTCTVYMSSTVKADANLCVCVCVCAADM